MGLLSWLIHMHPFGGGAPVPGDFMHAETGGLAGALIPPANYSGSGLGKTDLSGLDDLCLWQCCLQINLGVRAFKYFIKIIK